MVSQVLVLECWVYMDFCWFDTGCPSAGVVNSMCSIFSISSACVHLSDQFETARALCGPQPAINTKTSQQILSGFFLKMWIHTAAEICAWLRHVLAGIIWWGHCCRITVCLKKLLFYELLKSKFWYSLWHPWRPHWGWLNSPLTLSASQTSQHWELHFVKIKPHDVC